MREKLERTHVRCHAGIKNEDGIQAFAGARLSQAQQVVMQKDDDWGNGRLFAIGRAAAGTAAPRFIFWPDLPRRLVPPKSDEGGSTAEADDPMWLRSCAGLSRRNQMKAEVRRRRATLG